MASDVLTSCEVCEEDFTEAKRCPRLLPCSHSMCDQCLTQLISRNNKSCPFCRQKFTANTHQDLPKNRYVLAFLNLKESNTEAPAKEKTQRSLTQMMDDFKEGSEKLGMETVAECEKNIPGLEQNVVRISELDDKLVHSNNEIDIHIEKLNDMKDNIRKLRKQLGTERQISKAQLRGLRAKVIRVKDLSSELKTVTKFQEVVSVVQNAEDTYNHIRLLLDGLKDYLSRQEKVLINFGKTAEMSERIVASVKIDLHSKEENNAEVIEPLCSRMVAMANQDEDVSLDKITVIDLLEMSDSLKKRIQENKVFAVHHGESARYARISYAPGDEKVFLHHLKTEDHLPSDAKVIKYDVAMSLFDSTHQIAFLEFGVGKQSLGKMSIKLINDSNYSSNFAYLCTGEKGPSYAHSCVCKLLNKDTDNEFVWMGNYENKGGKAVVPGVDWKKELARNIHTRTLKMKGFVTVTGKHDESTASIFGIFTSDRLTYTRGIFGIVESGLDVLTGMIANYPNISDVRIIDCGIVLSQ